MVIDNKEEIIKLITKYSITLIIFAIFSNFVSNYITMFIWNLFDPEIQNQVQDQKIFSMIVGLTMILVNSVIAIIIATDVKRNRLGWLIIVFALFYPTVGAILLIFCKAIIKDEIT